MEGLSEKVPPCLKHLSEQDAKDVQNWTTVTGSTTRAQDVAFSSVVGTLGGGQPTRMLDPSESFPLLPKILISSGPAPGFRKVQMGRRCSLVMAGKTPYFATYRLPRPICGINLGNCRLCIMALPAVIHQYLTSASSISLDF